MVWMRKPPPKGDPRVRGSIGMRKLAALLTAMLLVALPSLALADAAGSAKGVKPAADAALAGETRTLRVGSDVFIGDLVQTGPRGQV